MKSFKELIDNLGGRNTLHRELEVEQYVVHKWYERDSIPSKYWLDLKEIAEDRGVRIALHEIARLAS